MPDVIMPRLSDTMEEGELTRWMKKVGDPVRKGDVLAEIETDKATMDLEAFDDGILEQLLVPDGTLVPIGQEAIEAVAARLITQQLTDRQAASLATALAKLAQNPRDRAPGRPALRD